jgi:heme a synthase
MTRSTDNPWLHRFAVATAFSTLLLIALGGLVTSKGVGMAVPDWPTTYGYNMFLFPIHLWTGGIFYEHSHRLFASFVGFLTTILAVWLWLKEERRWMRWLGVIAFFTVVLQGVLGGLRVVKFMDEIGIFHAALAQIFLLLLVAIAVFTSRYWRLAVERGIEMPLDKNFRRLALFATLLIFAQLVLGATMRHQHAGLAVPDFPLAYGQVWPRMDREFIARINQQRSDARDFNPITAFQIGLHMSHRIGAFLIMVVVALVAWQSRKQAGAKSFPARVARLWFGLILVQFFLGAMTVWSNKAADMATAHVVVGAMSLSAGAFLTVIAFRFAVRQPIGKAAAETQLTDSRLIGGDAITSTPSAS